MRASSQRCEYLVNVEELDCFKGRKLPSLRRKGSYDPEVAKEEMLQYLQVKTLSGLHLDEEGKIGYTYKTMASAFVALRQFGGDFRKAICAVAGEGGDSDTNAAVTGALLGAVVGESGLPKEWLAGMPHVSWLRHQIDRFIEVTRPELGVRTDPEFRKKMQAAEQSALEAAH